MSDDICFVFFFKLILTSHQCFVRDGQWWLWSNYEPFHLKLWFHRCSPSDINRKGETCYTDQWPLLLPPLGKLNFSGNTGTDVAHAHKMVVECWQESQVLFYVDISLLFKPVSRFLLSYLHFLAQKVWIAVQVPHRWWVWFLIHALKILMVLLKLLFVLPQEDNKFFFRTRKKQKKSKNSKLEVLYYVKCKADSREQCSKGFFFVVVLFVCFLNLIPDVYTTQVFCRGFILSSIT